MFIIYNKYGDDKVDIAILGAGAYALALAHRLSKNKNNKVIVWSKVEEEINDLIKTKTNEKALPGIIMPSSIEYTNNIEKALQKAKIVIIGVATKYLRNICEEIKPYVKDKHIVIASKGIEQNTNQFASSIVKDTIKTKKLCTISGPSFAKDMVLDELIGLSIATTNNKTKNIVIKAFSSNILKLRPTNDFIGVELCGTLKNIIAIIAGMLEGMKVSESTKAMFLTESINDTRHLIKKLKGNEKTILSYAGYGDILLTCTSTSSRNYSFGKMIGSNASKKELDEYLKNNTVEGIYTLQSIYGLIKGKKIKLPFIDFVYNTIFNPNFNYDIISFLKEKS